MKKILLLCLVLCMLLCACGDSKEKGQEKEETNKVVKDEAPNKKKIKEILANGKINAENIGYDEFMAAYSSIEIFEKPNELFTSRVAMETFFYNASLVENTKYSNVEPDFIALGHSKEEAKEYFQILVNITTKVREFSEEVYLGNIVYMEDDEKFLNKYNKTFDEVKEIAGPLINGKTSETTKLELGEEERGAFVVSTYDRLETLETKLKWEKVNQLPGSDKMNRPKLNDSTMVFGDYYAECKKVVGVDGDIYKAFNHGFDILHELSVAYGVNEDNTVVSESVEMVLELKNFNSVDVQDMYYYFASAEEMANYYMDAMVTCMQIFYKDFGISDSMRDDMVNMIENALGARENIPTIFWVSANNEFGIVANSDHIIFRR